MTGWIGIALGDVTGIGPEVTLKALAATAGRPGRRYLLLGDGQSLRETSTRLGIGLRIEPFHGLESPGPVCFANAFPEPLPSRLPAGAPIAARAAMAWLEDGARRCLQGELDALVTAPVNKEAIVRAGFEFIGQTEFLSALAGTTRTAMMLLGQDDQGRWLRVALVTTHVALRELPARITEAAVRQTIELALAACRDLGLPRARVAVCGLNPHAGEGGQFGEEEQTVISPAIRAVRGQGGDVVGPLSADAVFYQALHGEFDVVVAMYHDQGLGPLKTVAFERGINWTLGLPFIRTSPDHGTAYDIAGRGVANPSSMIAALRLAEELAARRTCAAA